MAADTVAGRSRTRGTHDQNAATLPVQLQSKVHPVVAGVIEISVGVARVRIEGTPDAATLGVVLRTLRAAAEAET